jgi:hypothetical protein
MIDTMWKACGNSVELAPRSAGISRNLHSARNFSCAGIASIYEAFSAIQADSPQKL